jgi:DEAD/DEAH box helicase domain-containing protein
MDRAELDAGLSGLAAVLHSAACLLCMCDPRDLDSQAQMRAAPSPAAVLGTPTTDVQTADEPAEFTAGWRPFGVAQVTALEIGWPTVYVYDSVAGGVGFAERCHQRHGDLVEMARQLTTRCGCDSGCPSCVGPGTGRVDGKAATLRLVAIAQQS